MEHDKCKHELEFGNIASEIKNIILRLDKTESKTNDNTKHIQDLRENKASTDEKFMRVFELLGDLKSSIDEIQKAIKERNERLPTLVYSVAGMVLGGSISGVLVWLLTK